MSEIRITIGITSYREGELLRECWESVLAQTDDRWEAVIVSDGGADQITREVFAGIEHPKLRKFSFEENRGACATRNKAFELTETPYSLYLDGDDMLPPNCITAMNRTIEAHPGVAFVFGDVQYLPSGRLTTRPAVVSSPLAAIGVGGWGLYRVQVWRRLGGFFDIANLAGYDTDFLLSLWESGSPMLHCGRTHYLWRNNRKGSLTSRWEPAAAEAALAIVARHPTTFSDREARRRYLSRYFHIAVHGNVVRGDQVAGLKCVLKGFRHLGVLRPGLWLCLGGVLLGKTIVTKLTPYVEWLWRSRIRLLGVWHGGRVFSRKGRQ